MYRFLIFSLISCSFFSCRKKDIGEPISSIILKVAVKHHALSVKGARVYLKYDATSFPGKDSSVYEKSLMSDEQGIAIFDKLLPTNFYLYSLGFDGVDSVVGYMPIVLTQEMLNKEHHVTLLVSETH